MSEREIFGAKALHSFNFGGVDQCTSEVISPAMICATEKLARTAALGGRPRTVAADVVECAQNSVLATSHEQWFPHHFGGEVIARTAYLIGMAHHLPASLENFVLLCRKNGFARVELSMESPRAGDIAVDVTRIGR